MVTTVENGKAGPADRALVAAIRAGLAAAGDPERAVGQQRYMRSVLPFHGVAMGQVRAIVSGLVPQHPLTGAEHWQATVRALWDQATHREERYAALALVRHRAYREFRTPEALDLLCHLVRTGAWWDLVDEVAAHPLGEILRGWPGVVVPVMTEWAAEDDMWVRRAAILSQLRAKAETDTVLLDRCLRANLAGSAHGTEFFIRKAVGWALREYAKTDAAWVQAFLGEHADLLSPLSIREASKHLSGT